MPAGVYDRARIPRRGRPGFLRTILGDLDRDWMAKAECARLLDLDMPLEERQAIGSLIDEIFFPVSGRSHDAKRRYARQVARGKNICATCPVAAACEGYRRALSDENGVWGGFDEFDRDPNRTRQAAGRPRLHSSQEGSTHL